MTKSNPKASKASSKRPSPYSRKARVESAGNASNKRRIIKDNLRALTSRVEILEDLLSEQLIGKRERKV